MGSKGGNKKNLLIGFDLSIPRQKYAYDTLINEKKEKGMPFNLVIHEALELYANQKSGKVPGAISAGKETPAKKGRKKEQAKEDVKTSGSGKDASYELTEEELEDPYLLDNLGALYSDER